MSKFFEFYFNPQSKKDTILETFCFSPASREEEKLGNLYLLGELKNVLPKNRKFLKDLAEIIKNEYYAFPQREVGESSKESLKKANQFLEKEFKKENTTWLGNLNFFVFSLASHQKFRFGMGKASDFPVHFSKVGNLKIFLFREEEIFNLGDEGNIKNSAVKTFSNIVEGKLTRGDRVLILGEELFENLWQNQIFSDLKLIKKPREFKKLFKKNKESLREFFGVLLFIFIKKERRKIYFHPVKLLSPCFAGFNRVNLPKIPLPFSETYQKIFPQSSFLREKFKKSLRYILILILLLLLGYLIFQ